MRALEGRDGEETGKQRVPSGISCEMGRAGLEGRKAGRATLGF